LPGSNVTGDLKVMLYVSVAPAQPLTMTTVPLQVFAADVGRASTLRPSIRPRAIRILIIFLTSFLLSNYQAFPDFEAV
jgi:hypothetical protein